MKQYIYGKNPIMEALKGASVYKIYMLNGHKDPKIFDICKRNQIPLEFVDKKEFDKKVGKVVHQGVMAYIENYRYYTIDEILKDIPENKQPLLLMLDGLEDPHNLGAILRTCDAVGVDGVIIGKNRSVGLNGTVAKVSTGAIHHVKVAQVTNLTRTLEDLKKKAFWVVGCELENSQDYRSVDYNMPTVLVIGSEGFCAYQSVRGFRIVWIEKHQEVLWIELFFLCFTLLTAYKIWKYIKTPYHCAKFNTNVCQ